MQSQTQEIETWKAIASQQSDMLQEMKGVAIQQNALIEQLSGQLARYTKHINGLVKVARYELNE